MNKTFGFMAIAAVFGLSTGADAHTLRLECKKITSEDVVCRAITSDGELARDVEIQLLATTDYRVLATAKTDAAGMYAFKVPDVGSMSLLWATRPMSPVLPVWISGNRFMHA